MKTRCEQSKKLGMPPDPRGSMAERLVNLARGPGAEGDGNVAAVRKLLDAGADMEAKVQYYGTALTAASSSGRIEVVRLLLDRGADIEATYEFGETALMVAAQTVKPGVVRLLAERGANLEAKDRDGATALINVSRQGSFEMVSLLVELGADVLATRRDGCTALGVIASRYEGMSEKDILFHGTYDARVTEFLEAATLAAEEAAATAKRVPADHPPVPKGAPPCEWAKVPSTGDEALDWEIARTRAMQDRRPGDLDWGFSVWWLAAAWVAMCLYAWGPDLAVRALLPSAVR